MILWHENLEQFLTKQYKLANICINPPLLNNKIFVEAEELIMQESNEEYEVKMMIATDMYYQKKK